MKNFFNIVPLDKQNPPYHLLVEADPSEEIIADYLHRGVCFLGVYNEELIGVLVLLEISEEAIEVKNIAIVNNFQRRGFAKEMLAFAEEYATQKGFQKLIITTGNSSIGQLALYQKVGFEMHSIERNFFVENYEDPIFENGIQCKHRIILEKILK